MNTLELAYRKAAVLAFPEAVGRGKFAAVLVAEGDLSLEECQRLLAASPMGDDAEDLAALAVAQWRASKGLGPAPVLTERHSPEAALASEAVKQFKQARGLGR